MAQSVAQKEALVVILDVGASMKARSKVSSSVEDAKAAVLMLLQNKIQVAPRDETGVVLMGSTTTRNPLADKDPEEGFANLEVVAPIEPPVVRTLRTVTNVRCTGGDSDFLDALILAVDMIHHKTEGKKWGKRVILVTDAGMEATNKEDIKPVIQAFQAQGIKLFVIGVGFRDEDEDGEEMELEEEDDANEFKRHNEAALRLICKRSGGMVIPVQNATQTLSALRAKSVLQRSTFRECLYISDQMAIPLWGFLKTSKISMPSLKKMSRPAFETDPTSVAAVSFDRRYYLEDDPEQEVPVDHRIKAFRYGKSLVPFSDGDLAAMKFTADKSMKLIAFADATKIPRKHFLAQAQIFVPPPGDTNAEVAVSALVHALFYLQRVAIVRYVRIQNAEPVMGVLTPVVKPEHEYFIYNRLPFVEDLRTFAFQSFSSTKVSHRQEQAMSTLIDAMDLSKAADGEEAMKPKHTFNPCIQHFYQSVRERAMNPDAPIPPLSEAIAGTATPWDENGLLREMLDKADPALRVVKELFPTEKVGKQIDRKYWFAADNVEISLADYHGPGKRGREEDEEDAIQLAASGEPPSKKAKGLGGGYFDDGASSTGGSLGFSAPMAEKLPGGILSTKTSTVSTITPVKDFNEMMTRRDVDLVEEAINGLVKVIHQLLKDSIGDQQYGKIQQAILALRQGATTESEPGMFNTFLRAAKISYSAGRRQDFWDGYIVHKGITLISNEESAESDVGPAEARAFLSEAVAAPVAAAAPTSNDDDLFGDLE